MRNTTMILLAGTFALCSALFFESFTKPTQAFLPAESPGSHRAVTVRTAKGVQVPGFPDHQQDRSWLEMVADGIGWLNPRKWSDYHRMTRDEVQRRKAAEDRAKWGSDYRERNTRNSSSRNGPEPNRRSADNRED